MQLKRIIDEGLGAESPATGGYGRFFGKRRFGNFLKKGNFLECDFFFKCQPLGDFLEKTIYINAIRSQSARV